MEEKENQIVTRIFIKNDGDIVVTDLWEDLFQALVQEKGGECDSGD